MRGDFSRLLQELHKQYTGVLMQQGRVQLDSDWDAASLLTGNLQRLLTLDVVGHTGAPRHAAGFEVAIDSSQLTIGAGRYYVNGVLCENSSTRPLAAQPFLPGFQLPPMKTGFALLFLDVWQHTINAFQDPQIHERALGGADTTVRLQSVWQVRSISLGLQRPDLSSFARPDWSPEAVAGTQIELSARIRQASEIGNHLYRVEIHNTGNTPTFKWSRTNASSVVRVAGVRPSGSPTPNQAMLLDVETFGIPIQTVLSIGQLVEWTDDSVELNFQANPLWEVAAIDLSQGTDKPLVTLSPLGGQPLPFQKDLHPMLRCWDQPAPTGSGDGSIPIVPDTWVPLEHGIEVRFTVPPGAEARTADYWMIPSRTLEHPHLIWPQDKNAPARIPPQGIRHHYAPVALVEFQKGLPSEILDLRLLFASAVELSDLIKRVEALEAKLKNQRG